MSIAVQSLQFSPVLRELVSKYAPVVVSECGVDKSSRSAAAVQRGLLRPEGRVFYLSQGAHGIVYAASTRTRPPSADGKRPRCPILGRLYSTFLFDPYRRPFQFIGVGERIAQAWCTARREEFRRFGLADLRSLQQNADDLKEGIEALGALAEPSEEERHLAHTLAELYPQRLEQLACLRAGFEETLQAQGSEIDKASPCLARALDSLKAMTFPTIDLFLYELCDRLTAQLRDARVECPEGEELADVAASMASLSFAAIVKCNALSRTADREVWPIFYEESRRTLGDAKLCLMADSLALTGDVNRFEVPEVLPQWKRQAPAGCASPLADDEPEVADVPDASQPTARKNKAKNLLRVVEQPISHESLRQAFRSFLLGAWYFDERLQRNTAMPAEDVLAKPRDEAAAMREHTERVRARVDAALSTPLADDTPTVLVAERAKLRRLLTQHRDARRLFPFFADTPWRIGANEVRDLQRKHFGFFASLPQGRGERVGNCNSIAFTLLDAAAEEEQRLERLPDKPVVLGNDWGMRSVGAQRLLELPRPRVLHG